MLDRDTLYRLRVVEGRTVPAIAAATGYAEQSVRNRLTRYGISDREVPAQTLRGADTGAAVLGLLAAGVMPREIAPRVARRVDWVRAIVRRAVRAGVVRRRRAGRGYVYAVVR